MKKLLPTVFVSSIGSTMTAIAVATKISTRGTAVKVGQLAGLFASFSTNSTYVSGYVSSTRLVKFSVSLTFSLSTIPTLHLISNIFYQGSTTVNKIANISTL